MKLKDGVSIIGMQPQVILGLWLVEQVYKDKDLTVTVTSITDSKHGAKSLHYKGLAFDLRTKDISETPMKLEIHGKIKEVLGKEWDVVLEDLYGPNEHIHCEFDPKVNS